jgi:hypothetical protein
MARNTRRNSQSGEARRYPKWTTAEEEVILDEIGKNPTNIKACLMAAAEQLPVRSYYGCANHWYSKMANRDDVIGRLTIGRTVTVRNKTRLKPEQEATHKTEHPQGLWKRVVKILFNIQL